VELYANILQIMMNKDYAHSFVANCVQILHTISLAFITLCFFKIHIPAKLIYKSGYSAIFDTLAASEVLIFQ